jgi:hypothetical protein
MLAFRSVQQSNHCAREEFLYELKTGPADGRLRRPSSAGKATTGPGEPTSPPYQGRLSSASMPAGHMWGVRHRMVAVRSDYLRIVGRGHPPAWVESRSVV